MLALRRIALTVLWTLAGIGVVCGALWATTVAGLVQPLIVVSGSMEPAIMTGDLLLATKVPAESLSVGDVVSLESDHTSYLVTHRIESIAPDGEGGFTVAMKGDANEYGDVLDYSVAGDVWMPQVRLPGMGSVVERLTAPAVSIPLMLGLAGLFGLTWIIPAPTDRRPRVAAAGDVQEVAA